MVDTWTVMQAIHQPGAGAQYVSTTGNDANPGTSASRKRTIQAAINALGSGGGVVYVASGSYGDLSLSRTGGTNTTWVLVKAETQHGVLCGSIGLSGTYLGIYGLVSDGEQYQNCIALTQAHHIAIWGCIARNGQELGIGGAGNHSNLNNVSICYNLVHDCSYYSPWAGSGISLFEFDRDFGSVAHTWINGYDNVIVGNIVHSNRNDPNSALTQDGNGIIIDDMHNNQSYSMFRYKNYTGNWLVMGNLCTYNGGVGVHPYETDNVVAVFNTAAENNQTWGRATQIDCLFSDGGCVYIGNVAYKLPGTTDPEGNNNWWADYAASGFSTNANVALNDTTDPGGTRIRNTEGYNYFVDNTPDLTPMTVAEALQWTPDGGSGAIERFTITQDQYNAWAVFPDLAGNYRPVDRSWACGAIETEGGGGDPPDPVAPTANFSWSPTSPIAGQQVQFTDTSTGVPTGWAWDFGDGAAGFPLPEAGLNGAGHFSGRILIDGNPYPNVIVKVVDAQHPNWGWDPGQATDAVLNTDGGHDGVYVWVTNTDADGFWSVTGLNVGRTYMLKIFPPSVCAALAEIPAAYVTAETGYIAESWANFMSTPASPSNDTYRVFGQGRLLFDMPVHVDPQVAGALNGSSGYSDLNVEFTTRTSSFPTTNGTQSGCVAQPPVGGGTGSTLQNPTKTFDTPGSYVVTLEATNAQGSSTKQSTVTVTTQPSGGGGTFEAEDAAITSGYPGDIYALHATAESPGYTGEGHVGYWGQTGEKLVWTISAPNGAGAYTATFRFHTPEGGTRTLWVNGVQVGTITFAANAGSWGDGTWSNSSPATINLNTGTNTIELRHAGDTYTGYIDLDSMTLTGGGTNATVTLAAFGRTVVVPGVSVQTSSDIGAVATPPSISAPVVVPAIVHQRTATTVVGAIGASAGADTPDSVGQLVVIDVTVEVAAIVARGTLPIGDIEAKRMLAGRYLLMGGTKQRIQG